jgi:hypothetical protein
MALASILLVVVLIGLGYTLVAGPQYLRLYVATGLGAIAVVLAFGLVLVATA